MQQKGVKWTFNPPAAAHYGGVWERLIRTLKRILFSVTKQQTLDDESLLTVMCEVEMILNSRPLTTISDDPNDLEPLTPNQLLLCNLCSHREFLNQKTCMSDAVGAKYSTYWICSGPDGLKNTFRSCRSVRNGTEPEETLHKEILY